MPVDESAAYVGCVIYTLKILGLAGLAILTARALVALGDAVKKFIDTTI